MQTNLLVRNILNLRGVDFIEGEEKSKIEVTNPILSISIELINESKAQIQLFKYEDKYYVQNSSKSLLSLVESDFEGVNKTLTELKKK